MNGKGRAWWEGDEGRTYPAVDEVGGMDPFFLALEKLDPGNAAHGDNLPAFIHALTPAFLPSFSP